MPAASSTGHVQHPPRTVQGGTLTATPPGAGQPQMASHPPLDQTEERLTMTISDPDEWTCEGQADLLDELEAEA
jgi:hypothetical protein